MQTDLGSLILILILITLKERAVSAGYVYSHLGK